MTQDRRITDKLPGHPLQWDDSASPSAAPAAGQAGLAKLVNAHCNDLSDCAAILDEDGRFKATAAEIRVAVTELRAAVRLAAPVAASLPLQITDKMAEALEDAVRGEMSVEWDPDLGSNVSFGSWDKVYAALCAAAPVAADTERANWRKALHELRMAVSYRAACITEGNQDKIAFADEKLWAAHEKAGEVLATPADAGAGPKDRDEVRRQAIEDGCHREIADLRAEVARLSTPGAPVTASTELLAECRAVFDLMLDGCNDQKFGDYQNGHGEEIGPRMDALRAKLRGQSPAPVTAEPVAWAFPEGLERLARVRDGYADSPLLVVHAKDAGDYNVPLYTHPAPADRDAIRNEALEEAAKACDWHAEDANYGAAISTAKKCATSVRALKSMERAADAKGDQQ